MMWPESVICLRDLKIEDFDVNFLGFKHLIKKICVCVYIYICIYTYFSQLGQCSLWALQFVTVQRNVKLYYQGESYIV